MLDVIDKIGEFLLYPFIFFSLYFQVFMFLNFFENRAKIKDEENMNYDYFPSVSFLLPGWNEAKNIKTTIYSIQNLDYPKDKIEILYLDNNSTDNTKEIITELQKNDPRIKYFFIKEQGKHNALNCGLKEASNEIVICLDVDSSLDKNALKIAVQYFKDENIKGVCSCMQIRESKSIWQKIQAIEYLLAIFWRKNYSVLDAVQVMPGPFSLFRKNIFAEVGNYKRAYNAEDFEMTLRLHKYHFKIANAHKAYVYTSGPYTLKGFIRQRIRWIRGFLSNAWDYKFMFLNKKYGHFGLFTLPVAGLFVFYVLYAVLFAIFKFIKNIFNKIDLLLEVGFRNIKFNFDLFFVNTDFLVFQSIFIFTILSMILFISHKISENKHSLVKNLPFYFLLYPFIVPFFLLPAVYKFLFKKENKWVMQDNKM